ncbi:hypothetical protein MYCTH_2127338 [Thermothelomyces thermophilus ATCC 42464]|uniref:Uncharacterized protein n=1 Tax=Thermothelomyces thermophilus (strain ATCC 42464 / BCRC 31852 / DSM 1799) TaxID=573729 RepID=G2QDD3_THET4|nr:uncharacterized protein MYCTH_2127338 [Thermothelomyces thermophilus ATCC 42464]AEO58298.1 hypothetical protein MYCTH_2127338 [Thermothelomyces thermophilus ATCC 42464]
MEVDRLANDRITYQFLLLRVVLRRQARPDTTRLSRCAGGCNNKNSSSSSSSSSNNNDNDNTATGIS